MANRPGPDRGPLSHAANDAGGLRLDPVDSASIRLSSMASGNAGCLAGHRPLRPVRHGWPPIRIGKRESRRRAAAHAQMVRRLRAPHVATFFWRTARNRVAAQSGTVLVNRQVPMAVIGCFYVLTARGGGVTG